MLQTKIGHFESDNGLIYIPIGFLPDVVLLFAKGAASGNLIKYIWFREMELHDVIDGWIDTPNAAPAQIAAGSGIASYDTGTEGPTVTVWSAGLAVIAKTATARGSFIKATADGVDADSNRIDRSAIFEVMANVTTGATEPTWPTVTGETVVDDHGAPVQYQLVKDVPLLRRGYQGFRLAAAMTGLGNGHEGYFIALGSGGNVEDYGDVDSWSGGIRG